MLDGFGKIGAPLKLLLGSTEQILALMRQMTESTDAMATNVAHIRDNTAAMSKRIDELATRAEAALAAAEAGAPAVAAAPAAKPQRAAKRSTRKPPA